MDVRKKNRSDTLKCIFLESPNKEHLGSKSSNGRCFNTDMKMFIGGPRCRHICLTQCFVRVPLLLSIKRKQTVF